MPSRSPASDPAPITSSMSGRVVEWSAAANRLLTNARPAAPPGKVKGPFPAKYCAADTGDAAVFC